MPRPYSSKLLRDCPADQVFSFVCIACPRAGQYRRDTLIARFGADTALPDLPNLVAADCPKILAGNWHSNRCGVRFGDLQK